MLGESKQIFVHNKLGSVNNPIEISLGVEPWKVNAIEYLKVDYNLWRFAINV